MGHASCLTWKYHFVKWPIKINPFNPSAHLIAKRQAVPNQISCRIKRRLIGVFTVFLHSGILN